MASSSFCACRHYETSRPSSFKGPRRWSGAQKHAAIEATAKSLVVVLVSIQCQGSIDGLESHYPVKPGSFTCCCQKLDRDPL